MAETLSLQGMDTILKDIVSMDESQLRDKMSQLEQILYEASSSKIGRQVVEAERLLGYINFEFDMREAEVKTAPNLRTLSEEELNGLLDNV